MSCAHAPVKAMAMQLVRIHQRQNNINKVHGYSNFANCTCSSETGAKMRKRLLTIQREES